MTTTKTRDKQDTKRRIFVESKLTFAESEKDGKQLSGLVVPWEGNARGYGLHLIFDQHAFDSQIELVENGGKIPLQDSHSWEPGFPIGLTAKLEKTEEGLVGTFNIPQTSGGMDAIELVKSGICEGLSAGLVKIEFGDIGRNWEEILTAELDHVALLHNPAFAASDNVQVLRAGVIPKTPLLDKWTRRIEGENQQ